MTWRGLALDVASVSAGNYAAILTGILTNVWLARILGASEYGRLALMVMASQVLLTLGASWTLPALIRYGAQEHALHGSVLRTARARTGVMVPSLAVLLAIVWLLREPLARYLDVPANGVAVLVVHIVALALSQTIGGVLQAGGRMALYGMTLLADRLLVLGVLAVLTALVPLDAVRTIAASAFASLAVVIAGGAVLMRLGMLRAVAAASVPVREFVRFSVPQIGGSWAGLFGSQWIDYVIIRRYLTLADLGLYALAFQIAGSVQQLIISAVTVLMPRFSAMVALDQHQEIRRILGRLVPLGLLAFSIGIAALILSADWFVPAIFGERFAPAVPPLLVLLVASLGVALFSPLSTALAAYGVVWPVTLAVVLAVIVNFVLDLLLIPSYGILGSAVATAGSYAVSSATVLFLSARRLGVDAFGYALFVLPALAVYLPLLTLGRPLAYGVAVGLALVSVALIAVRFRLLGRAMTIDSAARSE